MTTTLEPCQPATATVGVSGKNTHGKTGWTPACPPSGDGMHRYMFELYALNREALGLPPGANRQQVEAAIAASILDQAHVEATYQRE